MLESFFTPFISIALSELGDKTQLAILGMSAKTTQHKELLFGVLAAFFISTILAVVFGALIASFIPHALLKIIAGIAFIFFGITTLIKKQEKMHLTKLQNPIFSSFTLILLSEMGDKSQLTTSLFATRLESLWVFFGAFVALALLSILAVYIGKTMLSKINPQLLTRVAACLFVIIGITFIFF